MDINLPLIHILILISSFIGTLGVLPPEVEKCKSTDNDKCIKENIMKIMNFYPHGYPEIGLPEISSITVKDVVLAESTADSPIQLNFKFNTFTISGLDRQEILRSHGFNKNLSQTIELDFFAKELQIDGDYEMDGKLLLLPLKGKGVGNVVLKDVTTKYKIKIKLENRNEKIYGVVDKIKILKLEPKKIIFNLQNIVNNNDELSKTFNDVINDNWTDLWKELESKTINFVANNFQIILNGILSTIPIEEFYSD